MTTFYLSPAQLASVASVGAASSKDKAVPVLATVKLSATPATVTAFATDRYVAAQLSFPLGETAHTLPDEGAELLLSVADLTALAKTREGVMFTFDADPGRAAITGTAETTGGASVPLSAPTGNYPPIQRLFPDEAVDDLAAGTQLSAGRFAQLAKLRLPGEKVGEAAAASYALSYPSGSFAHKRAPIVASRAGGDSTLTVLVQPFVG